MSPPNLDTPAPLDLVRCFYPGPCIVCETPTFSAYTDPDAPIEHVHVCSLEHFFEARRRFG